MPSYKVIPFMASIKTGGSAEEAAYQLNQLIDRVVNTGWKLHHVANVNIEIKPGCLWGLLGAKSSVIVYNQVIFEKDE
jgi:hypothetical protein